MSWVGWGRRLRIVIGGWRMVNFRETVKRWNGLRWNGISSPLSVRYSEWRGDLGVRLAFAKRPVQPRHCLDDCFPRNPLPAKWVSALIAYYSALLYNFFITKGSRAAKNVGISILQFSAISRILRHPLQNVKYVLFSPQDLWYLKPQFSCDSPKKQNSTTNTQ